VSLNRTFACKNVTKSDKKRSSITSTDAVSDGCGGCGPSLPPSCSSPLLLRNHTDDRLRSTIDIRSHVTVDIMRRNGCIKNGHRIRIQIIIRVSCKRYAFSQTYRFWRPLLPLQTPIFGKT